MKKVLRYEYKYFVPIAHLEKTRMAFMPFMQADRNAQETGGQYTVRSIYFDTPDLACYYDKLSGIKRRNKIRLRGYNLPEAGNSVFFEIKEKVDEPLSKRRLATTYPNALRILQGTPPEEVLSPGDNSKGSLIDNACRFMYHIHARQMRPVVTVIYEREPYQSVLFDRDNDLRVTFDKNLRAVPFPAVKELFSEKGVRYIRPQYFILEIKFNNYLPSWVKAVTAGLGLVKGPASKYAMAVESFPEVLAEQQAGGMGSFGRPGLF
jgi:hypothetical protein